MKWTRKKIVSELRAQKRAGADLSYNAMSRRRQDLVSAAAYHCGSYRAAVTAAGVNYADVLRRPRWTKARIANAIKQAHKAKRDLNWASVSAGKDELAHAAFAALRPELFNGWSAALKAAGVNPRTVSRYQHWSRKDVVAELKRLHRIGKPVNSGALQKTHPALHAAAVRRFGGYPKALRAAGIDPVKAALRESWTRAKAIDALKSLHEHGELLSTSDFRREHMALYGAILRIFGSINKARAAAKIRGTRAKAKPRPAKAKPKTPAKPKNTAKPKTKPKPQKQPARKSRRT